MAPVKPLGELRWFEGCYYIRDREMCALTMSHKTFAVELVRTFCVTFELSVPLRVRVRLGEWEDEGVNGCPSRELVDRLM